ncbi:unnamed protein product [Clavelina lepadiformis]|uniref:PLAT domain-containing protein n=1 Tax=Clavelina lepadiformis TaxID=159417 RepID=A0ABP0GUP3_CLALP
MDGNKLSRNLSLRNISGRILFHPDEIFLSDIAGNIVTCFTVFDVLMIYVIFLAVACIRDQKIDLERQPVFLPVRPPRGFRLYAVLVETGQSPAGGTSAKIFLRICGALTKTAAFTLVCCNGQSHGGRRRLFGSQNKDLFILSVPHYLGRIDAFEVMTDRRGDSPPWFLRSIRAMCLNNRKCWKSKVGMWLRGDKKPYRIKADLIGALSTKEYLIKVFLQNYNWAFAWYRSLGSTFTSIQRCAIHWTSMAVALWLSHFLLYYKVLFGYTDSGNAYYESVYSANEVVVAAFVSSAAGVFVGFLLRFATQCTADGLKWARVDDKDDFSHLMGDHALIYAEGAVVRFPSTDGLDDCLGQLRLTKDQIKAIKHITECGVSDCSLKEQLNNPVCKPEKSCCYSKAAEKAEVNNQSGEIGADVEVRGEASLNAPAVASSLLSGDVIDPNPNPMEAEKRGFRTHIEEDMRVLWEDKQQEQGEDDSENKDKPESLTAVNEVIRRVWNFPRPSVGRKKVRKKARWYRERSRNQVPSVSGRVTSGSNFSAPAMDSSSPLPLVEEAVESAKSSQFFYDSLSEPESDQELVTKSARTDSEIKLARRPSHIYEMAPRWQDAHRVWVQAAKGGIDHHEGLHRRYDLSLGLSSCCLRDDRNLLLDRAIARYKEEEYGTQAGGVLEPDRMVAYMIALFGAFAGIGGIGFVIYQRLFLSNSDSLLYLYAVMLVLVLHSLVFSVTDAVLCALAATWFRRRRILRMRTENAEGLRMHDSALSEVGSMETNSVC